MNEDIVHILNKNLTEDSEVQLSKLEDKLVGSTTIDDVRAKLQLQYVCMTATNTTETEELESEKAFAAFGTL